MNITQRQATITVFILQIAGTIIAAIAIGLAGGNQITLLGLIAGAPIFLALLAGYLRGWEWARYINLVLVSALVAGPLIHPATARGFSPVVLIPAALALVLASYRWIAAAALGVIAVALIRSGGQGGYAQIDDLIAYLVAAGCMVVGRLIADQSQRVAQQSVAQAQAERARAEQQAVAVSQQAEELARRNTEQQRLLSLVSELEVPAVSLADDVLLVPLVGGFDTQRMLAVTDRLLRIVHDQRTRLVVLDIAGSASVDGAVARDLSQLARAIQLLGCKVAISGITAAVATTLIAQDVSFSHMTTVRSPQEALRLHAR